MPIIIRINETIANKRKADNQTFRNQTVGTQMHDHSYHQGEKNHMFKSFDRMHRILFTSYSQTEKQEHPIHVQKYSRFIEKQIRTTNLNPDISWTHNFHLTIKNKTNRIITSFRRGNH